MSYIEAIEDALSKKAQIKMLPLQPGDVPDTYADVSDLFQQFGYKPSMPISLGVKSFVDWYRDYFGIQI
jgi:UDP-glucuronate 4-epimerase